MAQGTLKSKKLSTATSKTNPNRHKPSILGPKKGSRTIAPRKAVLVKNAKMTKKHSAGLTAMTERTLGAKAGHLELLKGGKKNKDLKADSKTDPKATTTTKGGSKKFG